MDIPHSWANVVVTHYPQGSGASHTCDPGAQTLVTYMTSVHSRFSDMGPSTVRACSGAASEVATSALACLPCFSFFCRAQKLPPMKRPAEMRKKLDMQKT